MIRISVLILILSFASVLCGCGSGGGSGSSAGGFHYPLNSPSSQPDQQPSPSVPEEKIPEVISGENVFQPAGEETSIRVRMLTGPWTSETPKTEGRKNELSLSLTNGKGNGESLIIGFPKNELHSDVNYELPIYNLNGKQIALIKIIHKLQVVNKPWLFITYIAADNNLTSYQIANLKQMETIGSDENTHLVAFIDIGESRLEGTSWNQNIDWTGAKAFYVTKNDEEYKINSEVIKDYGNIDSGSADTLESFLTETLENFPSQNIAFILNNHGGAYGGSMSDYDMSSIIKNPDMKKAILNAETASGRKINVIGFDACLMASIECLYEFRNTADYICVSEETIGGRGWDYDEVLGDGSKSVNPIYDAIRKTQNTYGSKIAADVTPERFAISTVTMASNHWSTIKEFAAIDTSKLEKLHKDLDSFADKVLEKASDNPLLKEEIAHLLVSNEDNESAATYGGDYYGLYDLTEMLYVIKTQCSDDDIADAAAKAFFNILPEDGKTIGAVVSAYDCGNIMPFYRYSYGISVFTTFNTTVMNFSDIKEDYMEHEFAKSSSWTDMLKALELI